MVKIPFSYPPGVRRWPPKPSCALIVDKADPIVTLLPHFISSLRQAASAESPLCSFYPGGYTPPIHPSLPVECSFWTMTIPPQFWYIQGVNGGDMKGNHRSSIVSIHRQATLQWPGLTTVYAWLPPHEAVG